MDEPKKIRIVTLDGYEDYDPHDYITRIIKDSDPDIEFKELVKSNISELPDTRPQELSWIMGRGSGKVLMQRRLLIKFLYPEFFRIQKPMEYLFHGKEKFDNVRKQTLYI